MKKCYDAVLPLAVLLLACCLAGACSDNDEAGTPPPTICPQMFRLELACDHATRSTVEISITSSIAEAPYIYLLIEKTQYEALGSDEALLRSDRQRLEALAAEREMTLEAFLEANLVRGNVRSKVIRELSPGVAYYLYAYGLTPAGDVTSPVFRQAFTTEPVPMAECTFETTLSAKRTSIRVDVVPSDKNQYYYYELLSDARYQEAGGTPEQVAARIVRQKIDAWLALGAASVEAAVQNMALRGDHGYDATGLDAGARYHLFVCGVDLEGYVCTKVEYAAVSTEEFEPSANVIALTVGDIEWDSASVEVSTTNDDPYLLVVKPASELADKSDEEIMEQIVAAFGETVEARTRRGAQKVAFDKELMPDQDYEALAFGYEGGITTSLVRAPFATPKENQAGSVDFTFTLKGHDQITISPSDESILYLWGSVELSTYQGYGGTPAGLRSFVQDLIDAYIPDVYASAAEYVLSEGQRGEITEDHWIFAGDGDYLFYAVWMNPDGTFAADPVVSEVHTF